MSTTSYSSNGSRPTSRHHDTGFPDSFASCTTSMRHPDAIIDPSFSISAEHIDPARTLHHSRKSLLHKHRRTISHGKINEESFGSNYAGRLASRFPAPDSATGLVDQHAHEVGSYVVTCEANTQNPSHTEEPEKALGLGPAFQYVGEGDDSDERRRSNIFRKLMHKS
ncbi:hypothetical protein SAMD00023353_1401660 [Rosellinia necatrix]|uniref:Uncharacterized protein n=1 Tax=Rosellinia necatrix TaxID=77044 RepID=A0A1W2TCZ5_ROSNE|nr:hypothetical protein SAMD00023353_1401660 [Rosellinia necatrix]